MADHGIARRRIQIEDGSTWPTPEGIEEVAYRLVHGAQPPDRGDVLFMVAVSEAYVGVMTRPEFRRKPAMMRRALREGSGAPVDRARTVREPPPVTGSGWRSEAPE